MRQKVTISENISFIENAFGIWLPDCSTLVINLKKENEVTILWHEVIVKLFWAGFVAPVNFSYYSKFHRSISTGSGVVTILSYQEMTRNPETGNTHVWVLHAGIPNLAGIFLIKCYWMLQNAKFRAFFMSELLREDQQAGITRKISVKLWEPEEFRKKKLEKYGKKMSEHVNVRMSKIMRTPIKVGTRTYATYANCRTLNTKKITF